MSRIRVLTCALLLVSCGNGSTASPDMRGVRDLSEPSFDMTRPPDTVKGRLVDDHGAPRGGVPCQLCTKKVCLAGTTGSDGRIGFIPKLPGDYHFRSFSDDPISFGDVFFPVPIGDRLNIPGFMYALGDDLTAPAVGTGQKISVATGGTFHFDGDITLEVPAGSLTIALAQSCKLFAIPVARAKVAPQLLGSRAQLDDGIYLTLPFGALCNKKGGKECKITLPLTTARADGTKVELAMPSLKTGMLESAGEGTVTGGKVTTDAGQGLAQLGWIVLYAK